MSLTANFDFCVELGLAPLKAIYHLALKNEELFPHNLGPFDRNYSGEAVSVSVRMIDDLDSPADLAVADAQHIRFTVPIELTVQIPDAPDPNLSQITLRSSIQAPGALATWPVDGQPQLGVDFAGLAAGDVVVPAVDGLPVLDSQRFANAIHQRYLALPSHTFLLGPNTLVLYDGSLDPLLDPPNKAGDPQITATIEPHGADQYLRVTLPIHADVPQAVFNLYGVATFWRLITEDESSVSVDMATEPTDTALVTQIDFDGSHPAEGLVVDQLKPLLIDRLAQFNPVKEPWFTEAFAEQVLAQEAAAYLAGRKYPMYTPQSGDPNHPLSAPVAFLLPADGVLAILFNRRTGTAADDAAPDNFLGGGQLALAIGRALLDETIASAISTAFPGIESGDSDLHTAHGDATLHTLTVTPSDPGDHGQAEGHLWSDGTATVHIPCWPDPDVSFSGPIFLRMIVTETDQTCDATIDPVMGDFSVGESCCDVFVDLIIPVVGWIMLAVIESTIDEVGGELAADYASQQATEIQTIPPVVVGVAELQSCLEGLNVSTAGLIFPGKLRIRREGTSFEDLASSGDLPRP
ncbi:MAG: hypothetical protein H0X27_09060 [Caulobacteraceae bacterium]|nr:hypothetical protein [Caulobacteraceae bacterium]